MANVFAILTAIVLALASFIAYKNKDAYEKEILITGNEIARKDALNAGKTDEQGTLKPEYDKKCEMAKLGYNQGQLDLKNANIVKTLEEIKTVKAEIAVQEKKEFDQTKVNAKLTSDIAEKDAEYTKNQKPLDDLKQKTEKFGDINELAAKMRNLKTEVEELVQLNATADAKLANLTAQNNQTENQVKSSKDKIEKFASGQSLASLNTRIRTIYPTWGFVTLAAGNNAGVVANSSLEVVRNGSTIAKLMVTSVEATTASASIVPDSLAQDTVLMVGDKVIASTKAPAAPAAAKHPTTPGKPATAPAAKPDATAKPDAGTTPDPAAATPDPAAATPDPAATPAAPAADATPAPASN